MATDHASIAVQTILEKQLKADRKPATTWGVSSFWNGLGSGRQNLG